MELALEKYDARTKYKQNFLGDLRSSGEAVTCLLEVPKHIAFLYMKLKLKKKQHSSIWPFLENEHSSKTVLLLRAPRKFVRQHLSNGLTLRAFRKLEGPFAPL